MLFSLLLVLLIVAACWQFFGVNNANELKEITLFDIAERRISQCLLNTMKICRACCSKPNQVRSSIQGADGAPGAIVEDQIENGDCASMQVFIQPDEAMHDQTIDEWLDSCQSGFGALYSMVFVEHGAPTLDSLMNLDPDALEGLLGRLKPENEGGRFQSSTDQQIIKATIQSQQAARNKPPIELSVERVVDTGNDGNDAKGGATIRPGASTKETAECDSGYAATVGSLPCPARPPGKTVAC